MLRKVIVWPDKKLKASNQQIEDVSKETQLIQDLIDTCNVQMGAGLAAPQIGINKRIVVIKPKVFGIENPDPSEYNPDYMVIINPDYELQGETVEWKEACLSIPGVDAKIQRKETCLLKYTSESGEQKKIIAEWPFSGGLQHECDHLLGKLFIHRMDKRKSAFLLERWRKKKRKAIIKAKRNKREILKHGRR
jgi:peptide deformylase